MSSEALEFKNNIAAFEWIFMLVWTAMLAIFTWLFIREGGFGEFQYFVEMAVIAAFWLFGAGFSAYFFKRARVHLSVADGKVLLRESWLWRSREESFPLAALAPAILVEEKDSEGDPYFRCAVLTPAGRTITICEGHHQPDVEAARDRLSRFMAETAGFTASVSAPPRGGQRHGK
jgi:hypothetical protein